MAMATGCGHGCGWGHILYSLCSIIDTLYYIPIWSYAYMAIKLCVGYVTMDCVPIWQNGCMATELQCQTRGGHEAAKQHSHMAN